MADGRHPLRLEGTSASRRKRLASEFLSTQCPVSIERVDSESFLWTLHLYHPIDEALRVLECIPIRHPAGQFDCLTGRVFDRLMVSSLRLAELAIRELNRHFRFFVC